MKKNKIYVIAVLFGATLSGCANKEVALINDKGERRYCYEVHDRSLSSMGAAEQFNKCLNDAGTAGFRRQ